MEEKRRYEQMLDITYELEGLLHLALVREEIPEALPRLIAGKIADLCDEAGDEPMADMECAVEDEIESETEEMADVVATDAVETEAESDAEPEDISENIPEDIPVDTTSAVREKAVREKKESKPAFSLNDRFLFTRELFGGRRADFDDALTQIASMESYEEAEGYFYDILGWNPENPVVADFMKITARYLETGHKS